MPENLVARFQELLGSSQVDVFTFLSSNRDSTFDDVLAVVLLDQQTQWKSGQGIKVEEYLARLPVLADSAPAIYQLVIGEWQAQHGKDSIPNRDDLIKRFPQLAELDSDVGVEAAEDDVFRTHTYAPDGIEKILQSRYRIQRKLGDGSFAQVYLAFDMELERQVAIKVPLAERFQQPSDVELYLAEARTVAALHHPHIVPVYDMGRTEDGLVFVVSRFIDGQTLEEYARGKQLEPRRIAEWIKLVADGLQYAHSQRIIHRDVKPANILIELESLQPFVADFGLAMHEQDYAKARRGGTPAYMSPEQTRGEGHRLDGRSDVFALGVILYELLTGRRPFHGSTIQDTLHQIVAVEPLPPSSLKQGIPPELERICLRALSKRIVNRFDSAAELARDLDAWLHEKNIASGPVQPAIVHPKGLRAFDAGDADFFLELLPGLRNRQGLPDSIAFWKSRIEETDPVLAFRIGLMYGPSGCGKSSLVKAGLLPRLSDRVRVVYVESTPDETEVRILRAIRKLYPALADDCTLPDALATLRRSDGQKLTIVVDQFEQWLHTHKPTATSELVQALLQCDGSQVQAILMVRDDFAMAVARLMSELEVRIVQGENFATVDLFETEHARKVLIKFGQAFGKLPQDLSVLSEAEKKFIDQVVNGLAATNGKVVSVQLSLFAEMIKSKPWSVKTLYEVGGTQGVGVNFLEETFGSKASNPAYRMHAASARNVLKALLPEVTADIKGHMRPHRELLDASGYANQPNEFQELLRILDGELRLITPTDPEGHGSQSGSDQDRKYYQLTHDYLVPALREWLTRKQRETRRGRAELKLAERAAQWNAKQESKQLPSLIEWVSIRRFTNPAQWLTSERSMMKRADRFHLTQVGVVVLSACLLWSVGLWLRSGYLNRQNEAEAVRLVEGALAADPTQLEASITKMLPFRRWTDAHLQDAFDSSADGSNAKLHAALCLISTQQFPEGKAFNYVKTNYVTLSPLQLLPVRKLLEPHKASLTPDYWSIAQDTKRTASERLHVACALAGFVPESEKWSDETWAQFVADQLVAVSPSYLSQYQELLRPVRDKLLPPLSVVFKDPQRSELARSFATTLLADYAADNAEVLTELLISADPAADKQLFPILKARHRDAAVRKLEAVLDTQLKPDWKDPPLDPQWQTPSQAAKKAIESAGGLLEERFAFCQSMPWDTFHKTIEMLRPCGYVPTRVRPWLDGGQARVAAVWKRDGRKWKLEMISTRDNLPSADENAVKYNLMIEDIARLPAVSSSAPPRWLAMWIAPLAPQEQRRVVIDATADQMQQEVQQLTEAGFVSQQTLTVANSAEGERLYGGIWSNRGSASEFELAYDGEDFMYQPQWDIGIAAPNSLANPLVDFQQRLRVLALFPEEQREQPKALEYRAMARYLTGNLIGALEDWDKLVLQGVEPMTREPYRTIALARQKKEHEAQTALEEFLKQKISPSFKAYAQIQVAAWSSRFDDAWDKLRAAEKDLGGNNDDLYTLVCASAICVQAAQELDTKQTKRFADYTVKLLERLIEQGYSDGEQLTSDPDFAAIHADVRFQTIAHKLVPWGRVAGLWLADTTVTSSTIECEDSKQFMQHVQELITMGYRPHSLAVYDGSNQLLLHLPNIPDSLKEELSMKQAAAAAALLRLDASAKVWPWLDHRPDPRMRSYLMDRLVRVSVDAETLLKQLNVENSAMRRRSLILGLGELARADLLNAELKNSLTEDLAKRYADDPDSGVHGAAEWALRQLKAGDKIADIQKSLATGKSEGIRQWFVFQSEQLSSASPITMMIIDSREPFVMGTPVTEQEGYGGTGRNEILHRRQLGRRFAISSHEVTVAQFQAFRQHHDFNRSYSREPEAPANRITWYDATEYCNWVSEQAGIPEDQWCYDPQQRFNEGMTLPNDYLRRTGYRLPTEAEWEYACRAGTNTARYFGETDRLLGQYAWYTKVSDDKFTLPVGTLRPNALGLFDMLGNINEWTQDKGSRYLKRKTGDIENLDKPSNSVDHVLRGGAFNDAAPNVRSAVRAFNSPKNSVIINGFRLTKTYP